ncbi:MAG: hypothetical protein WA324_27355 [Bryobacteraceae bacterium]
MERRQQHAEFEEIGGEPLEGSGFEHEQPVAEELVFIISPDQHKGEAS